MKIAYTVLVRMNYLGKSRHAFKNNITMGYKQNDRIQTGFNWLRIGSNDRLSQTHR